MIEALESYLESGWNFGRSGRLILVGFVSDAMTLISCSL